MEQANIPRQEELSALYGSWNPMGYMQGMENQDLASQFRQQGLQANQADIGAKMQKNAYDEQMNPLLLAQQGLVNTGKGLTNTGLGISNESAGLDLTKKKTLQSDTIEAERQALRTKIGDEQYNQLSTAVLNAHMENIKSGDPEAIQKTGGLLDMLGGPQAGKVADRIQHRNLKEGDWMQQSREAQLNRESAERIAEIRKPVGKAPTSPDQIAAKLGYEKGAAYYMIKADEADTPEEEAKYRALAIKFEQLDRNKTTAAASVNKPDLNPLGVQTLPTPPSVIQPNPKTPTVRTPQDDAAFNWAKANPNDPRAAKILQKLGQ